MWWSLVITVAFVAVEGVFGFRSGSLALLSDAGHNLTDALALGLAWLGAYLGSKPADEQRTYGYHRAGVLAAFVNALTLLGLSAFILWEAVRRIQAPRAVPEMTMLAVAALGLAVNLAVMGSLHSAKDHDLNVRAAWMHMFGDALGSAGIMAGAIVIRYTGWMQVDPVLSMLIAGLIVWTAWDTPPVSWLTVSAEIVEAGAWSTRVIRACVCTCSTVAIPPSGTAV